MTKRTGIISNLCIAVVLIGLGVAVFTTDLSNVFLTVSAPVYNGDRTKKQVSLMFTIDENSNFVSEILQFLKSKNSSATFFVSGKWASANPLLTIEIAKHFEIANYGYNNRDFTKLNEATQRKEIQDCHTAVKALTAGTPLNIEQGNEVVDGVKMKLFSPPMGAFNKTTLKAAQSLKYRTVMWSKDATGSSVFDKATVNISNGDLVLFSASAATLGSLSDILDEYEALGFAVIKVSQSIT